MTECICLLLICSIFVLCFIYLPLPDAGESQREGVSVRYEDGVADIVDPFKSTCYDWRGHIIPCVFKRPYAELLFDKPLPDPRFGDNQDGTVTATWNIVTTALTERGNKEVGKMKEGEQRFDVHSKLIGHYLQKGETVKRSALEMLFHH